MEIIEFIFLGLAYIAVLGFLISGLDDLFFDTHFLVYLFRNRKKSHVTLDQLKLVPEQWIAVFVPAWQEGGVVNKMAEYASRVLLYEKYDIFIGVYPNDKETMACVDQVCGSNPRIHKVVVPHAGPTNKADCLNWIHRAMRLNEVPGVREYQIVCIHDAEDVLHPLILKVYNFFVPRVYDMAQLPVFALEHPVWTYWSANTYIDDFSELHTKDLFIRESIGGVVPSAGVGTCFARSVLYRLSTQSDGDPFRLGNLTEDYEIGIRIKRAGYRTGIISYPVDRIVRKKKKDGTYGPAKTVAEVVAVRENFPTKFWAAVRQRTRWILGISFQTWEQAGWSGSLAVRYTLLRDRRAPLTHLINMAGYLTLLFVLFQWLFNQTPWAGYYFIKPLFGPDSLLFKLVIIDTLLLAYRAAQKFISVYHVYNLKQAIFSLPRVVVGNTINFLATVRAFKLYVDSKFLHKPLVWHKTDHVFPDSDELQEYSESIEDLLVEHGLVTREQIFEALEVEKAGSAPLCLLRMGLLKEEQFSEVWSEYSGLPVRFLDPDQVPDGLLQRFPESLARQANAIPVKQNEEAVTMAFREPPSAAQRQALAEQLGFKITPVLARPSSIAFGWNRAYPRQVLPLPAKAAYLESLRAASNLNQGAFLEVLNAQETSRRSLPDILIDRGLGTKPKVMEIWAKFLGCAPAPEQEIGLDQQVYYSVGPTFWWLHRMLPVPGKRILTGSPPHPQLVEWLNLRFGTSMEFQAELPSRIDLAMRHLGVTFDPDKALIDSLVGKGVLDKERLANIQSMRSLITDPVAQWLRMQKVVSEEDIHTAFLEICYLPLTKPWTRESMERLQPILPPGFANEHHCHPLDSQDGIRFGLGQVPPLKVLNELYHRLEGYPLYFQAFSLEDARKIQQKT